MLRMTLVGVAVNSEKAKLLVSTVRGTSVSYSRSGDDTFFDSESDNRPPYIGAPIATRRGVSTSADRG